MELATRNKLILRSLLALQVIYGVAALFCECMPPWHNTCQGYMELDKGTSLVVDRIIWVV